MTPTASTTIAEERVAAPEKMQSHKLTPVDPCGFNAHCPSASLLLLPATILAIVLAVAVTAAWIGVRRLIRLRRKAPSSLG
ncbi:hypothetical protein [Caulobacter sp. UNC358MFTsu5.1]|uniref:hypothetical protein n=1 Tax=Caulobacter sp. UNC358MFTsu5.1 TaxID=1449049 RepID=UPI0012DDC226|nr:hypothetical protein [Caulobacter sp. UNC358MFTsu5.1]